MAVIYTLNHIYNTIFIGFDDIWSFVPGFSWRQFGLTVVTGLIAFQDGLLTIYPIFAVYTPKSYNCESDSRLSSFHQHPYTFNGQNTVCSDLDECNIRDTMVNNSTSVIPRVVPEQMALCKYAEIPSYRFNNQTSYCENCEAFEQHVKNENPILDKICSNYSYQDLNINDTIVTKYNLVCDYQWLRDTVFSLGNVGLAVGSFLGGNLTDQLGRKRVMFIGSVTAVLSLAIQISYSNLVLFNIFWTLTKVSSQIKYLAYSS